MAKVHRPLRVVLLLRTLLAPAWMAELARILHAAPEFDVSALLVTHGSRGGPPKDRPPKRLERVVSRGCRSPGSGKGDFSRRPFALVDVREVVPALRVAVLPDSFCPGDAASAVDVAIAANTSLAREEYAARGLRFRLGVWYSPELDRPDGRVDFMPPFVEAGPLAFKGVAVTVQSVGAEPNLERQVMRADASRESLLAMKNRVDAAWGAASLVLAALEHACRDQRSGSGERSSDTPATASPGGESVLSDAASSRPRRPKLLFCAGRLASGAVKRATLKPQWLLAYQVGDLCNLAPRRNVRFVVPPADRFWADPQVVFADGEYHVFYEELSYRTGKGHIGTMRLGDSGPLDESRVALTSDCHLSYPFVFAFEGEWFMIPESAEAGRIDVFRADEFPTRWTLVRTLMDGVRAVDTTLVEHEGRWWLFTTIRKLSGGSSVSHLYLFSADNPLSEVWEPHPMNPIASGAAGARSAGGIMSWDHRLIRPSQDSRGSYGRRICLSEILLMTRDDFRERPAGLLQPNEAKGFVGLHTVSQARDLTIVDLLRWRTRL